MIKSMFIGVVLVTALVVSTAYAGITIIIEGARPNVPVSMCALAQDQCVETKGSEIVGKTNKNGFAVIYCTLKNKELVCVQLK